MANRNLFTSASAPPVTGPDYMNNIAEKVGTLFNAMSLPAATIVNSGNDYTITIDPVLNGDVVNGMGFYITPNVNNTGAARLRITSGNPYYDIVAADGMALAADGWASSNTYFVVFIGGNFVIYSVDLSVSVGATLNRQTFAGSGIWTKPTDLNDEAFVIVELWGGGGGGGNPNFSSGGGGGGAYVKKILRAGDLGATETVTIGSGGSNGIPGASGGNTSFGLQFTAYGGDGGGTSSDTGTGGNGGGESPNGGLLPDASDHGGGTANSGGAIFGGAGGGFSSTGGGSSYYGGGGGGGNAGGAGGVSEFGGNGGGNGASGSVPGGAGGASANGAAGQAIVRVVG